MKNISSKGYFPINLEKYVTSLVAVLRSYTKFIPGTLGGTYKRFHPRALPLNEKKAIYLIAGYPRGLFF